METFRVVHSSVYDIKAGDTEISFKVTDEMAPNAWITAQVIEKGKAEERSRAYGAGPFYIDNRDKNLELAIEEPGQIKPGKNDFRLKVTDSRGRPKEADITVMLVDEAILALTICYPDPWKYFTEEDARVETYDVYDSIIKPEADSSPF